MQRLGLMGRSRKISKQLHIWTRFHLKGEEPGDNFCNKTSMFLTFLIPSKNHVHLENDSSEVLVLLWPFCQARSSEKYVLSNLTPWTFWKLQLSLEEWDIYFQSSLPIPENLALPMADASYTILFQDYLFIWLQRVLVVAHGIFAASCRIFHCYACTL